MYLPARLLSVFVLRGRRGAGKEARLLATHPLIIWTPMEEEDVPTKWCMKAVF